MPFRHLHDTRKSGDSLYRKIHGAIGLPDPALTIKIQAGIAVGRAGSKPGRRDRLFCPENTVILIRRGNSMNVQKIILRGSYLNQLVEELCDQFPNPIVRTFGNITVIVEESFSARISANLSTTMILNYAQFDYCEIDLITAGGDVGFLKLGYGAGKARIQKFMETLEEICNTHNWTVEAVEELQPA
ncbi:MAG: hypothetical protein ACP5D7_16680 [Limnospira sp.]